MRTLMGLIALAVAGASSPSALAAARRAPPPVISHCLRGETILYSGRFTRAVGSVCLAGDRVHYRYGPAGHPEIDVVSSEDWSNVHYGWIRGGGGGYQHHVRFTVGTQNYVIFEGAYGNLTAFPGRRFSGLYVGPNNREGTAIDPRGRPFVATLWIDTLLRHAPRSRIEGEPMLEVQDGPWDGWF